MVEARPSRNMGRVFGGRQRGMAEVTAALDDAITGQDPIVMVAGDPSIGKTRTAPQLSAHAERRDAQVFWGWCYEDAGAPPYWPWPQPIRTYVQQVEPEWLGFEMGLRNNTSGESPDKYCINSCVSFIHLSTTPGLPGVTWFC